MLALSSERGALAVDLETTSLNPREAVIVALGDVAGKGMPAALLMSSLQASVKAVEVSATGGPRATPSPSTSTMRW